MMIVSVILIGKNEDWRLTKCLQSIDVMKKKHPHITFDIIYVDSNSTDDSIERAKTFSNTRIFRVTSSVTNAAIARNIGADESIGEVLFFIDADMEIDSEFIKYALDELAINKRQYITGHLDDLFYTADGEFLNAEPRTYKNNLPKTAQVLNRNGGLFIISREIWNLVEGMRSKYKVNEDYDLSIRLKKKEIRIVRIPYIAAKHHTIDYRNEKRMWKMLWQGNTLFPSMILRDHFYNREVITWVIRSDYSALLLATFFMTLFINIIGAVIVGTSYLLLLALRVALHAKKAKSKKNKYIYFFERYIFQLFSDVSFWIGFFFYYPQNIKIKYTALK